MASSDPASSLEEPDLDFGKDSAAQAFAALEAEMVPAANALNASSTTTRLAGEGAAKAHRASSSSCGDASYEIFRTNDAADDAGTAGRPIDDRLVGFEDACGFNSSPSISDPKPLPGDDPRPPAHSWGRSLESGVGIDGSSRDAEPGTADGLGISLLVSCGVCCRFSSSAHSFCNWAKLMPLVYSRCFCTSARAALSAPSC
mmetsp:Transcript_29435/g.80293  ORF Transcript_29435/g.80293 Transcript_29435/m.80293 type:complete len:201 (-) Transcript_29435:222-824(-)